MRRSESLAILVLLSVEQFLSYTWLYMTCLLKEMTCGYGLGLDAATWWLFVELCMYVVYVPLPKLFLRLDSIMMQKSPWICSFQVSFPLFFSQLIWTQKRSSAVATRPACEGWPAIYKDRWSCNLAYSAGLTWNDVKPKGIIDWNTSKKWVNSMVNWFVHWSQSSTIQWLGGSDLERLGNYSYSLYISYLMRSQAAS